MKTFFTSSFFILTSSLLFAFSPADWNSGGGGGRQLGGGGIQPDVPGGGGGNQPDIPGGGGQQPSGGGVQPDIPSGGGGNNQPDIPGGDQPGGGDAFIYDTFLTSSTGVGIDVFDGIWISTDRTQASIVSNSNLVQMVVGAAAGSTALTNVDLRASTALGEIPSCAFAGCENLVRVILPASVTNVAADAFIGCPKFDSVSCGGDPEIPDTPDSEGGGDTPPDQPEDFEPVPDTQDICFESEWMEASEGDSLIVHVRGGCMNAAASVKLCLSFQTAAAADLNLAKASVDGVQTKLKFPLVLTWASGEVATREISIPVKTDSSKEVDEQLTFQLASAVGCDMGGAATCTAVLHDAKGSSVSALPLAYGLVEPADAGRVTGTTRKAVGKSVTLAAKASSGYVFVGWYAGETCVSQTARLKFTMPLDGACYTARFVTKEEDASAISCSMGGCALSSDGSILVSNTCGVRVSYPIAATGISKVTVTASGLPTGLKLVRDKSTEMYSVEGIPTRASVKNAKFTVTSVGKSKRTFAVNWVVGTLPDAAVGTWNGIAGIVGEDESVTCVGNFTLTATAAGAVSAKAVTGVGTASFSGQGWIEDEAGTFWMPLTNKTYGVLCVRLDPRAAWTEDSLSANITGGKFGDEILEISAYRNPYGKTGKVVENSDAQKALLDVVGTWSVNVTDPSGESLSGTAKILKTGRVTVTGKLANGTTSYSMSGALEVRSFDEMLIPWIRLVGVTQYGCVWCNEEVQK